MAKILWKRANKTTSANSYPGANGEVVIDMEQNRIFLYDGANAYVSNTFASAPGTTYSPPAAQEEEEIVVTWSLSNITGVESTGVWASPPIGYAMHVSPDGKNYFTLDSTGDTVFQWKSDVAHDLANAYVYTRHFAEFDGAGIAPQAIDFRRDGKAMYVVDSGADLIFEFPLAEPWDLKTVKWINQANARGDISATSATATGLYVRSNDYFYITGSSTDTVYEYSWVAGNAASATATGASFYVGSQETNPQGLSFKPDGTEMYVMGTTGDDINRYTMTTPWDIANASFDTNYTLFSGVNPYGIFMMNNYFYYSSATYDNVYQWAMSSEWDLSTRSHVANLSGSYDQAGTGDSTDIYGLRFSPDGLNLYLVDARRITQWKLDVPWVLSSASNKPYATLNTEGGMGFYNLFSLAFKYDGTKMYPLRDPVLGEYTLSTPWDLSTATYVSTASVSSTGSPYDVEWSYNGNYLYLVTSTTVYQYDVFTQGGGAGGRWDMTTLGSTSPTTVAIGSWKNIRVSDDGNLSYWTQTNGTIDVYELSTPYDLTSTRTLKASIFTGSGSGYGQGSLFDGGSKVVWGQGSPSILRSANLGVANAAYDSSTVTFNELDVSSISTQWRHVVVKDDGTRMWGVEVGGDTVQQWNLSEAYNVASATANGSFSVGSQETVPNRMAWSSNGTIFYVVGQTADSVFKYDTTVAWDINFASYTSESKSLGSDILSFAIPPDGLSFYAGVATSMQKWVMDTPHDIINATQVWYDDPADFLNNKAHGLQYNSDGTKLWLFDYTKHSIRELKLGVPYDLDYMTIDEDYGWQFDTANAVIGCWVSESGNAVFGVDVSSNKITGFKGN